MPTDDVPPRISSVCPACSVEADASASRSAVCSISGTAPSVDHASSERNGITLAAGTHVYSA